MAKRNRGMNKPKLRDLSRVKPTQEQAHALAEQFSRFSHPIATAALGQVWLENALDDLLLNALDRNSDDVWDQLTGENRPLGSFHNKILIAYALGLFDETIRDGLNTVREIRNAFVHSRIELEFSHELVVQKLKLVSLPHSREKELRKDLEFVRNLAALPEAGPQGAYMMLCTILGIQLINKANAKAMMREHSRLVRENPLAAALYRMKLEEEDA